MTDTETLNDLLVDEDEINEKLLTETLGEYLRIGQDSGEIFFQEPFHQIDAGRRVAITLLAQKARNALDLSEEKRLAPSKISQLSGIKKGTVYPTVRDLEKEGYVKSENGEYWIPTAKIKNVSDYIEGGNNE